MALPRVAIVGRPNVGKSSLFNWLVGARIAVVDPTAGVTRDRVTALAAGGDRYFELIDTGGMGVADVDQLTDEIEQQIFIALDEADVIVFVVDAQAGLMPLDAEVADRLRRIEKPKLLVVNKCDSPKLDDETPAFLGLTDADVVNVSVTGKRNRHGLLEKLVEILPQADDAEAAEAGELAADPELKLAIVGRRNVGKSTFINALAQTERMIVSEVPGTTRDSVDVRFSLDGKSFVAIDTPGVRKRKSIANDIEFYGLVRAKRSIRRADVVLMFFDAIETISRVDKQLVDEIGQHDKPCIFVVNKWDRARDEKMTIEAWSEYLINTFASMRHVPLAVITALSGHNVKQLINLSQTIFKQARQRMSTSKLNRVIRSAIVHNPPPMRKNRRPKIFFATQIGVTPPTIVLKCNEPTIFDVTWKRYLLGVLRENSPFQEVPIRVYFRRRDSHTDPDESLEQQSVEPERISGKMTR